MKAVTRTVIAALTLSLFACGGGGGGGSNGGGSSGFYAGTWDFVGRLGLDDCNTGAAPTASAVFLVNQDGNRVVLNTGSLALQGTTNNQDGFDVSGGSTLPSGCQGATAVVYTDASDGSAAAALVLAVRCGAARCNAGWSGEAVLRSGRGAADSEYHTDVSDLETSLSEATAKIASADIYIERSYVEGENEELVDTAEALAMSLLSNE